MSHQDVCVCCGQYVPEGSMICPMCVEKSNRNVQERSDTREYQELQSHLRKIPIHVSGISQNERQLQGRALQG